MTDPDPLDELLAQSDPRTTTATPELREELTRMAVASLSDRRAVGSRRLRIAAGAGVAAVALFAGAGTAAATGVIEWGPWAQNPDVVYVYALPGGQACELRVTFDDPATGETARGLLAGVELGDEIDVDAVIDTMRRTPATAADEFGDSWDVGYGTESYPKPNEEYAQAVGVAVSQYLTVALAGAGVEEPASDLTWAATCDVEFADER